MTEHHFSDHRDEGEDVTEQTPLVGNNHDASPPSRRRPRAISSVASIAASIHVPKVHNPNTIMAIFCVVLVILTCANGFQTIPLMRIYEDIICHEYYEGIQSLVDPIDEALCKEEPIQSRLARLLAVSSVLDATAGCLTAMPWAFVADRFVSFCRWLSLASA